MSLENPASNSESPLSNFGLTEYQNAPPGKKRAFLQKIIQAAESRLFPDSWTKPAYDILAGQIHAGNTNFLQRKNKYDRDFRPSLLSEYLPKSSPYWRSDRVKSKDQPYNKWLYDPFRGYRTQNTALIHFLATQELRKIPPIPSNAEKKANTAIISRQARTTLNNSIKEQRALSLRKQVFQDAEGGDYTFIPEPGTPPHQSVTLSQLFPNHTRLSLVIGHPRKGLRNRQKVGAVIIAMQKNGRFYPENTVLYGRLPLEIWHGDRVIIPDTPHVSDSDSTATSSTAPASSPQVKGGTELRQQIAQLDTGNVLPKVPQLKIRPAATVGLHALNPEAISRSGTELDLDSKNCAQFAIRLLGKVHGRELTKRGIFADAWTMLHNIRAKEKQDQVAAGSYVKVAGDIQLDHKYYYDKNRNRLKVRPHLLYDENYLNDFARLYQEGLRVVQAKGIAFTTYYYHRSPNINLALDKTKALRRNGTPIGDTTPTTHIELLTSTVDTDFLPKAILQEIQSSSPNKGKYFELLIQTYIKNHLRKDRLPLSKTAANLRTLAIKRLSLLARCKAPLFLKDSTGKKRAVTLSGDQNGEYRLLDQKTGREVYFDKNNPETFGFQDLASRSFNLTNGYLQSALLLDFTDKTYYDQYWPVLPGKILELTGLKWPDGRNKTEGNFQSLITRYTTVKKQSDRPKNSRDKFTKLNDVLTHYRITPRDLPYYHAALRRVGVNPDRIVKDSPLPLFDLAKVKTVLFQEAVKTNQAALQEWRNLNKQIAATTDRTEKTRLEKARTDLIDKHTLPYLQRQLIGLEAAATRKLFSPDGLLNLQRQITNLTALIAKTDQQLTDLRSTRPRKAAAIRKALAYRRAISARRDYLQEEERKLHTILSNYLVLSVRPGLNKIGLLQEIVAAAPELGKLKLLPEEKRFVLEYVDRINQNIDLRLVSRGDKKAYADWRAGTLIFVEKTALNRIAAIVNNYRKTRLNNSRLPDKISCGEYKGKKGRFVISTLPPEVKNAIAQAANGDTLLSKLLLLTWAREQGRSGSSSKVFTRRLGKWLKSFFRKNQSLGLFQLRPVIFSHLVKKDGKTVRELKPGYAKIFGVRDYSELVKRLQTDIGFNTRVAAHLLKLNSDLIRNQLRMLKVADQVPPDSPLGATLVLSSFNRGPGIIPAAIINWRLEKLRKIFPYVSATPHLDYWQHKPWQLFLRKYSPPNTKPAALATAYKIYRFALALQERDSDFSSLTEQQIAHNALVFKSSPLRFLQTELYAAFVKFAANDQNYRGKKATERPFNLAQSIFSFQELYKKGVGGELNYGFGVTKSGQYEKLNALKPVADLLKLPPRRKAQPVAGINHQEH